MNIGSMHISARLKLGLDGIPIIRPLVYCPCRCPYDFFL